MKISVSVSTKNKSIVSGEYWKKWYRCIPTYLFARDFACALDRTQLNYFVWVCVPLAGTAVMSLGCSASASRSWERCLLMGPCRCNQSPAVCYWLILAIRINTPYVFVLVVYTYLRHSMQISVRSRVLSGFFRFGIFPRQADTWLMILYSVDFTVKFQTDSVSKVFSQHPWKRFYHPVLLSVSVMWASGMRRENEPGYVSPYKALHR